MMLRVLLDQPPRLEPPDADPHVPWCGGGVAGQTTSYFIVRTRTTRPQAVENAVKEPASPYDVVVSSNRHCHSAPASNKYLRRSNSAPDQSHQPKASRRSMMFGGKR